MLAISTPRSGSAARRAREATVRERSGEVAVGTYAQVEELVERAAEQCARGELADAAETYRQAAAIEARTGDMDRALVCLRMASSLKAELAREKRPREA